MSITKSSANLASSGYDTSDKFACGDDITDGHPVTAHAEFPRPRILQIKSCDDESSNVSCGSHADINGLSVGIVIRNLGFHAPDIHNVVSLLTDVTPNPDLRRRHATRPKTFVEDTTSKNGVLHAVIFKLM